VGNPTDINSYRQLAGGVTTAQLLHGSANPIGGQSALIKLKWCSNAEQMKIENAPGFIKFALGENVKQSNWGDYNRIRYPQTRMGVEQLYYHKFYQARDYAAAMQETEDESSKLSIKNLPLVRRLYAPTVPTRRDLEMDALAEVLNNERFITCHSYMQHEINMLMHVADSMGFTVNTFTHILEGYKVADKLAEHGANASTFSDWWAYKFEVNDAIPFNAAILNENGVNTGINSDDGEMGRRLNQEAAKSVKYGGVSEEDALKMVAINPAKMLHIDDRIGTIAEGKHADLVIWDDHPLSVYAKPTFTMIEGTIYYSEELNKAKEAKNKAEHSRIVNLMIAAKNKGDKTKPVTKEHQHHYECDTMIDYQEE